MGRRDLERHPQGRGRLAAGAVRRWGVQAIVPGVLFSILSAATILSAASGAEPARESAVMPKEVRLRATATCARAVVRLEDIAEPVDGGPWPQPLGRLVVALMPTDGRPLALSRRQVTDRTKHMHPLAWAGAEVVTVRREAENAPAAEKGPAAGVQARQGEGPSKNAAIQQASAAMPRRWSTAQLHRMVEQAVSRSLGEAAEGYAIRVDWEQPSTERLFTARRIGGVHFPEGTGAGQHNAALEIVTPDGFEQVEIPIHLETLPTAVATVRPLRRGEILSASDLTMKPVPAGAVVQAARSLDAVTGLELQQSIPTGGWISSDVVGPPTVVRRNDLVELRVVGGGVTIRTAARVTESGSIGDLITVETLDRRKQLIARVAGPNEVEIATRPQRVPQRPDSGETE